MDAWAHSINFIHFVFAPAACAAEHNRIYALSSDLVTADAISAVVVLQMSECWKHCYGRRTMPLPTQVAPPAIQATHPMPTPPSCQQDCACHRIEYIDPDPSDHSQRSVVVTEMTSSKVLQMKVSNILSFTKLREEARDSRHRDPGRARPPRNMEC